MTIHITQDTQAEMTYVYMAGIDYHIDYNADGTIAGIELFGLPQIEDITGGGYTLELDVEL